MEGERLHVLVTGASGLIGTPLVAQLAEAHEVIAFSRREVSGAQVAVQGNFASREDLVQLDSHRIDVAIHLAAELGDCSEEAAMTVNVAATRTLLRYLIDHGCQRLILASSIAAAGAMTESFVPRQVPIPDDHPFDGYDAYGLSKALVEEIAFYLQRRHPELEIDLLRVGGNIVPGESDPQRLRIENTTRPFLFGGGLIRLGDTVEAFARAVNTPLGPGVHRINVVGEDLVGEEPVAAALERILGERAADLDLSFYRIPGNERRSLYTVDRLHEAFGLRALNRWGEGDDG